VNNIKVLRSDNGGEYTSNEFKNFFKDFGIQRKMSVSYKPQQNGVA
jgi:transposase InsO family protein